jgi:hypothetical protein
VGSRVYARGTLDSYRYVYGGPTSSFRRPAEAPSLPFGRVSPLPEVFSASITKTLFFNLKQMTTHIKKQFQVRRRWPSRAKALSAASRRRAPSQSYYEEKPNQKRPRQVVPKKWQKRNKL